MKIRDARFIKSLIVVLWISTPPSGSLPVVEDPQNGGGTIAEEQDIMMNSSLIIPSDEEDEDQPYGQLHVNSGNDQQLKETPCEELKDCRNIDGSYCNKETGLCDCRSDHPITDSMDCFPESKIGEFCHYDEQCVRQDSQSRCDNTLHICQCQPRFIVSPSKKGWCVENEKDLNMKIGSYMDPALFGIMGGLALMFIIICVVLQLFSRAQFRENRTIFNTPNPRLMNVSLMKDSKLFAQVSKRKSTKYRNSFVRAQSSERSPDTMDEDVIQQGRNNNNDGRQKNIIEASSQETTARVTMESTA